jgi:hypothetical protein
MVRDLGNSIVKVTTKMQMCAQNYLIIQSGRKLTVHQDKSLGGKILSFSALLIKYLPSTQYLHSKH